MTHVSSFTVRYLAGMGALLLVGAVVGLSLTGEGHSGFVGTIEIPALLMGAALFVAAALGATSAHRASWPLLAALAALVMVVVLAFLTLTSPDAGSVAFFELAAVLTGVLLVAVMRRR
ncbi:hypothetical protein [Nocardioides sp.]|uniref:hypothetical protein n=1 Tax=Nocardioides sp. TaxID=35761 RepID=UPI00286DE14A|nr:hypothetical protein [Nocardioides sp.]